MSYYDDLRRKLDNNRVDPTEIAAITAEALIDIAETLEAIYEDGLPVFETEPEDEPEVEELAEV